MSLIKNPAAAFLISAGGNWRNAVYIDCSHCKRATHPPLGFLMIPGQDAKPILVPVEDMNRTLETAIDTTECAAALSWSQFEKLYAAWLTWAIDDPSRCALCWLARSRDCQN